MTESILVLRDVGVKFGTRAALTGIDLEVRARERIALIGRSGSGKSTLLAVASGVRRPTHGTIQRKSRLRLGSILQDPVASLNPRWTLEGIVAEPLMDAGVRLTRDARQTAVRRALRNVGLGFLDLTCPAAELSVGQSQRVALARALIASPDMLIADEPTSALDPSVAAGVLRLFDQVLINSDAALLLASHDILAIAPLVQRMIVLEAGEIVEEGSPTMLLNKPMHAATAGLVETALRLALDDAHLGPVREVEASR